MAAGLLLIAQGAPAAACSGTAAYDWLSGTFDVPVNGQVVTTLYCRGFPDGACEAPEAIIVLDEAGQPVPGEVTRSVFTEGNGALYTFKPAVEFQVGAAYAVGFTERDALLRPRFHALPAVDSDMTGIVSRASLVYHGRSIRSLCCEWPLNSCGDAYCVALEREDGGRVQLVLESDPATPRSQQWRTRVHGWRADETEFVTAWGEQSYVTYEPGTQYCIQGELESLIDGSTLLLEKHCVGQGDVPEFGLKTLDPMQEASGVSQCAAPSPGLEEAWCAGTQDRCREGTEREACERWEQYCASSVTSSSDTSAPTQDVAAADGSPDVADGRAGCALGQAPSAAAGPMVGLLLAIAGWRRRAARGPRRRTSSG